jgi:hypothetical protein
MSNHHVSSDMADYEKFATKAMDIAHEQGVDVCDPDAVEPVARAVAEEYALDEETLVERVRQRVVETEHIGNIYEGGSEVDVIQTSVLLERAREWAEETDLSVPDVDWSDRPIEERKQQSEYDLTGWRRDTDGDMTESSGDQWECCCGE